MLATLRQRHFFRFWLGGLVSAGGDWMLTIALPLHALALTGSALATGATLLATTAPRVLFGRLAGTLADRFDPARVLVACDLIRATLVLALLLVRSADRLWLLYAVTLLQASATVLFDASRLALVPRLIAPSSLVAAAALASSATSGARLMAPIGGGALMAARGLEAVAVTDALSFVVSALLTRSIEPMAALPRRDAVHELRAPVDRARGANASVIPNRHIRALFIVAMVSTLKEGLLSVLSVVFAVSVLRVGATERGLMVSAQGIGGLVGGLLATRLERIVPTGRLVGCGLAVNGLLLLAMFNSGSYPVVLALSALTGAPVAVAWIAHTALLQRATNAGRGRVFGALIAVTALVTLASQAVAVLGDHVNTVALLSFAASCELIAGLMAWVWLGEKFSTPAMKKKEKVIHE